jgi:uncharacterized coiled-coil protein SlyX
MASDFEDIKIVAMDDKASHKREPNTQMMNVVLSLSASAPHEWANHFNTLWKHHIYSMKRSASVSGKRLEIYCAPEELQQHIEELNKIIAETNTAYRQHTQQLKAAEDRRAAIEARERAELAAIKSTLKFD